MAGKRTAVSKKTRFEVFKRDEFVCQYCGATPPRVVLHVDHIVPVAEGGKNNMDNLITSCEPCNLGKGATPLSSVPKSLKEKTQEIAEREAQIQGYNAILAERMERIEQEAWDVAAALEGQEWIETFRRDNLQSIRVFLDKLCFVEVLEAAKIAFAWEVRSSQRRFKYFCGICWKKIREQNDGSR